MLEFIAANCDKQLTVDAIAEHVKLNPNYAMGIFHRVMQLTMKQYTPKCIALIIYPNISDYKLYIHF